MRTDVVDTDNDRRARSGAQLGQNLVHAFHAMEGLERVFQRGAEVDSGDQLPAARLLATADPFFVGAGRDLDYVGHAVGVIASADEILEALRLAADGRCSSSPQMLLADDAEQFPRGLGAYAAVAGAAACSCGR